MLGRPWAHKNGPQCFTGGQNPGQTSVSVSRRPAIQGSVKPGREGSFKGPFVEHTQLWPLRFKSGSGNLCSNRPHNA